MPTLSIISPVYNVSEYLPATLDSILTQDFADFELILVDDGSSDGSGEICDEYAEKDNRIVVIHKENGGVSSARNVGVAAARGDFIGFVDSDDLIEPNMYKLMLRVQQETGAEIVQCRHNRSSEIASLPESNACKIITGEEFVRDLFKLTGSDYTNQVALWAKVYCRKLWHRGILFPLGHDYEDEQETYKVCLQAEKIALIPDVLYHYIRRDNSIITAISAKKMLDKQLALQNRLHYLPGKLPDLHDKCASTFYSFSVHILLELHKAAENEAFESARRVLLSEYASIQPALDKSGKLYLSMAKSNQLAHWLAENDFEPIQNFVRRVAGKADD